jgi:hypothetical protein
MLVGREADGRHLLERWVLGWVAVVSKGRRSVRPTVVSGNRAGLG